MLDTHEPDYGNLQEIKPSPVSDLLKSLRSMHWADEPQQAEDLLTRMLADLAACDTFSVCGSDFEEASNLILDFFSPEINNGSLEFAIYPYEGFPQTTPRYGLTLYPAELKPEMDEALKRFSNGKADVEIEPVMVDRVVLHAHFDTVQAIPASVDPKSLASLHTYVDKNDGLVYTRGANDMKTMIAVLAMLSIQLQCAGIPQPIIVLTADEEESGILGGRKQLQSIKSSLLTIDLEPIAGHPLSYAQEILPSFTAGFGASGLSAKQINEFQARMNATFSPDELPMVSYEDDIVRLSLTGTDFDYMSDALGRVGVRCGLLSIRSVGRSEGFFSPLRPDIQKILEEIFMPYRSHETRRPISGISRSLGNGTAAVQIYANYINMTQLAHPSAKDVIVAGTDEAGGRRHTKTEAIRIKEANTLRQILFRLVSRLHSPHLAYPDRVM